MIINRTTEFQSFLQECFKDERRNIELRLSNEEIEYAKEKYPKAVFKKMSTGICDDGKTWYVVTL
ncbi:MAG: hypothetical protein PHC44_03665 [Lutispora sp.]|nr:hypothetical protein [Lutispora sp.]MDD4833814.1 hypothetical protein [Lutispora sp.]